MNRQKNVSHPKCILVRGIPEDYTSLPSTLATLRYYFEDNSLSGGGRVCEHGIQATSGRHHVLVEFESETDAVEVIKQAPHSVTIGDLDCQLQVIRCRMMVYTYNKSQQALQIESEEHVQKLNAWPEGGTNSPQHVSKADTDDCHASSLDGLPATLTDKNFVAQRVTEMHSSDTRRYDNTMLQMKMLFSNTKPSQVCGTKVGSEVAGKKIGSEVAGKKVDSQVADKKVDSQVTVKKVDSQVAGKKVDSEVAGKKVDSQVTVKKVDSQVAGKKLDSQVAGKEVDSQVAGKKVDSQVAGKEVDSQVAGKKVDSQVAGKEVGSQVAEEKGGNTTATHISTPTSAHANSDRIKARISLDDGKVIYIAQGDMTKQVVDAIVNVANNRMDHVGGMALAIVNKGGSVIQHECTKYINTKGTLKKGQVFTSQAGMLPCKKVIHTVKPVWQGGSQNEVSDLRDSVCVVLQEASRLGLWQCHHYFQGFLDFRNLCAARLLWRPLVVQINVVIYKYFITSDFLKKTTSLKEVHIIENNINLVDLFKQEADEYVVNKDGKQGAFDDFDSAETQEYEKANMSPQPKQTTLFLNQGSSFLRDSQVINMIGGQKKPDQELYRKIRSILNKLTPQKFHVLMQQMLDLEINTEERLSESVNIIFEKAIAEPAFSVGYANACKIMAGQLHVVSASIPSEKVTFKKLLLNRCQTEFKKDKKESLEMQKMQQAVDNADTEDQKKLVTEEMELAESKAQQRSLGNIRFIGELFKLSMLTERIMHNCIMNLLKAKDGESLECLCTLVSTLGKSLDHEKAKPLMDQYFAKINKIVKMTHTSVRTRFKLQDLQDLRRCGWKPSRDNKTPKTIEQIHKGAGVETVEKAVLHQRLAQESKNMPRGVTPRGAVENILSNEEHVIDGNSVTIKPYQQPSKDQDDAEAPITKIHITGIKPGTSGEMLQLLFENEKRSGGGEIQSFELDEKGGTSAVLIYVDDKVAQRVLAKKTVIFKGNEMMVTQREEAEQVELICDKKTVCVTGLAARSADALAVENILSKEEHVIDGKRVSVKSYQPQSKEPVDAEAHITKIHITGIKPGTSGEMLHLLFENEKRSGGDEIQSFELFEEGGTSAVLIYVDDKVAQRVLAKKTVIFKGNEMMVTQLEEAEQVGLICDKKTVCVTGLAATSADTLDVENIISKEEHVYIDGKRVSVKSYQPQSKEPVDAEAHITKIHITGIKPGTPGEMLHLLFENEKRSGGGEIQSFELFEEGGTSAVLIYVDDKVAQRVLAKKTVIFKGNEMMATQLEEQVELIRDKKTVGVPSLAATPADTLTVENIISKEEHVYIDGKRVSVKSYQPQSKEQPVNAKAPITKIHITGIKPGTSTEMLHLLFENEKRSGGGEIQSFELFEEGGTSAVLIYVDDKVAQRVLAKKTVIFKGNEMMVTQLEEAEQVELICDKKTVCVTGLAATSADTLELWMASIAVEKDRVAQRVTEKHISDPRKYDKTMLQMKMLFGNTKPSHIADKKVGSEVAGKQVGSEIAGKKVDSQVAAKKVGSQVADEKVDSELAGKKGDSQVAGKEVDSQLAGKKVDSQVAEEKGGNTTATHISTQTSAHAKSDRIKARITLDDGKVIYIAQGDLTKQVVDAIVNVANNRMDHVGGMALAIVNKGGSVIQHECTKYINTKGTLKKGQVFTSQAGMLPCKKVIHTVKPVWQGGSQNEVSDLRDSVCVVLQEASRLGLTTLAIPPLFSGIFGFPKYLCCKTTLEAISDFLQKTTSLKEVHIIENNITLVNLFKQEVEKYVGNKDGNDFDNDFVSAETEEYEKDKTFAQSRQFAPPMKQSTPCSTRSFPLIKQHVPASTMSAPPVKQSAPPATISSPSLKQSSTISPPLSKQSTPHSIICALSLKQSAIPSTMSAPLSKQSTPHSIISAPYLKLSALPSTMSAPSLKQSTPPSTISVPSVKKSTHPSTMSAPSIKQSTLPSTMAAPSLKQSTPPPTISVPSVKKSTPPSTMSAPLIKQSIPPSTMHSNIIENNTSLVNQVKTEEDTYVPNKDGNRVKFMDAEDYGTQYCYKGGYQQKRQSVHSLGRKKKLQSTHSFNQITTRNISPTDIATQRTKNLTRWASTPHLLPPPIHSPYQETDNFTQKKASRLYTDCTPVGNSTTTKTPVYRDLGDESILQMQHLTITVTKGDITKQTSDAIVNSTTAKLDLGSQVSKAILTAGGNGILRDCRRKGITDSDHLAVTTAGNLRNKWIIHLAGPWNHHSTYTYISEWKDRIKNVLKRANGYHLKSLSFPALGTGIKVVAPAKMAEAMFAAFQEYGNKPSCIKDIRVIIYKDITMVKIFKTELEKLVQQKKGLKQTTPDLFNNLSISEEGYCNEFSPDHFVHMGAAASLEPFSLENVNPHSFEYKEISEKLTKVSLRKIQRVQNTSLKQKFLLHKKHMYEDNSDNAVNERRLWHGTEAKTLSEINTNGFNRSFCGKNGTAYGKGVYFATHASTAVSYAKRNPCGKRYMYYCRVLTGEFTQGHRNYCVPPAKDTSRPNIKYDSVVDNTVNPSMFVVFHDTQAFPEYLITFI